VFFGFSGALGPCHAQSVLLHVEDKAMLPHQCASQYQLIVLVKGQTVLVASLWFEVFGGSPNVIVGLFVGGG